MGKCCGGGVILVVIAAVGISYAGSCPIVFIHGQKGGEDARPTKAWIDWNGSHYELPGSPESYRIAMDKIRIEGYGGYTPGEPFNCHVNTELISTGGETRKIYNFSYYNPDGSKGVIGSNGHILLKDYKDWRTKYIESLQSDDLWVPLGLYDEPSCIGCCLFSFGAGLVGYEIYKSFKDTTKRGYYPKFSIGISYSPGIAYTGRLSRSLETGEMDPFHMLYWNNIVEIEIRSYINPHWAIGIGGGYMWTSLRDRSTPLSCYPSPPGWGLPIREDWLISTTYGSAKVKRIISLRNPSIFLNYGIEYYSSKGVVNEIFTEAGEKLVARNFGRGFGSFLEIGIEKFITTKIIWTFLFNLRYGVGSCYRQEVTHEEFTWHETVDFNFSGIYLKMGLHDVFRGGGRNVE